MYIYFESVKSSRGRRENSRVLRSACMSTKARFWYNLAVYWQQFLADDFIYAKEGKKLTYCSSTYGDKT